MPNETSGERLLARRYRLVTQVGRGGMGTVWQAHDEVLGRDVAVKEVILPHGLTDEERSVQYKRTFREARTAARLGHPGVVTVYDVVEEDGRPWIIMELIKARSLDQVIKEEGPLPSRRAAEIGRQMLAALHAAHDAGVLHRDVKPSNVLITSTGREADRAVLTDFGIATASGDATLTQTGLVMGSPAYIAPERARGRIAGPASDLWSLGVTLYAMVHGKSPFERSEPMAALVAVISEEPDPPHMGGPLIPIIKGLLRKNPDVRMDAIEAGALLDEIVRQETVDTQRTMAVEFPLDELPGAQAAAQTAEPHAAPEPYAAPEISYGVDASYASETYADKTYSDPRPPASTPAPAGGSDRAGFRTRVTPPVGDATRADERGPADPARVTSWFQDPGTRPAREAPGTAPAVRPGGPDRRNAVIIGVVVLVAVIAAVGIALANSGGGGKPAKKQGSTSGQQGFVGRSPSGTVTPTETKKSKGDNDAALPAGFHMYRDDSGYSILVPDGWKGPEHKQGGDFFYSPDRRTYLQVDQTSTPGDSALTDWQQAERGGAGFQNYSKIKLGPTGGQPPVQDDDGKKSADWEFTYDSGGERIHILNRGFVTNDHGYAILLRAPDKDWGRTFEKMQPVYRLFQPVKD